MKIDCRIDKNDSSIRIRIEVKAVTESERNENSFLTFLFVLRTTVFWESKIEGTKLR